MVEIDGAIYSNDVDDYYHDDNEDEIPNCVVGIDSLVKDTHTSYTLYTRNLYSILFI